jgi:hypothetical protein
VTLYECRVPGCDWAGTDLDGHLVEAHGWTRDEIDTQVGMYLLWKAKDGI